MITIEIIDTGNDRYSLRTPSGTMLGRLYDSNAEQIKIIKPVEERTSTCFAIIETNNGVVIDHKQVLNDTINVDFADYNSVLIGFSFLRKDGSRKNSDYKQFVFGKALDPKKEVSFKPEQEADLDLIRINALMDINWKKGSKNILEKKNVKGEVVGELELSPFVQEQSDLSEEDEQNETFVKGKVLSNLKNDVGFVTKTVNNLDNYYNKLQTYSKEEVKEEIQREVASITATQIRNKEPNLVIETTDENIQTVATEYIVTNYSRQPQEYDGLYLTLTDHDNQVVEFAFHNGSWINVGFEKVDLSSYVDLFSEQTVQGRKVWEDEALFKKIVDYNSGARFNNSGIITTDTDSDSVVEYNAKGVNIEKGGDTKTYFQQFQENSGFIALLKQTINEILKHSSFKNIDSTTQKEDTWATSDIDTILSMTHENETINTSVSVQKGYAEMSSFGVGENATNSRVSVTSDTILLSSAETRDTDSKHTTLSVTSEGAMVNGEGIALENALKKLEEALDKKLKDKLNILGVDEVNRVYIRKTEGLDSSLPFTYTDEANSIAYRNQSGQLQVEAPSQDKDAANKSYVDKSQKYLSLSGESGTLDDSQYALVTGYDNLIIQRSGVDYRRCGYPSNGQGNYTFITPYWAKPNGTKEWADYVIIIKQDKTWEFAIENNISISEQTYPSVVELTPSTATNGILSDDNFDYLTNHHDVKIKLNGEYYIMMDDGNVEGLVSYIHEGWNGNSNQVKSINITLATKAWTLVLGKNKYYRHYIQLQTDGKALYYDFSSTRETAYTADTLPAMPDDIITAFQIVANGYYSSVSGLVYRNSENALKVIVHGMYTTDGTNMSYLQITGKDATFVKDTVRQL